MWSCGTFILGSWGSGYGPVVEALRKRDRKKSDLIIYRTEHWDSPLWCYEVTRVVKWWNSVVDLVTLTKALVSCKRKLLPQMDSSGMLRWAEGVVIDLKKQVFFLRLVSQTIRSQSFHAWLSCLHLHKIPPGRLLNSFTTKRTQTVKTRQHRFQTYCSVCLLSVCVRHTVQSVCWLLCETYCSFSLRSVRVRHRVQSVSGV